MPQLVPSDILSSITPISFIDDGHSFARRVPQADIDAWIERMRTSAAPVLSAAESTETSGPAYTGSFVDDGADMVYDVNGEDGGRGAVPGFGTLDKAFYSRGKKKHDDGDAEEWTVEKERALVGDIFRTLARMRDVTRVDVDADLPHERENKKDGEGRVGEVEEDGRVSVWVPRRWGTFIIEGAEGDEGRVVVVDGEGVYDSGRGDERREWQRRERQRRERQRRERQRREREYEEKREKEYEERVKKEKKEREKRARIEEEARKKDRERRRRSGTGRSRSDGRRGLRRSLEPERPLTPIPEADTPEEDEVPASIVSPTNFFMTGGHSEHRSEVHSSSKPPTLPLSPTQSPPGAWPSPLPSPVKSAPSVKSVQVVTITPTTASDPETDSATSRHETNSGLQEVPAVDPPFSVSYSDTSTSTSSKLSAVTTQHFADKVDTWRVERPSTSPRESSRNTSLRKPSTAVSHHKWEYSGERQSSHGSSKRAVSIVAPGDDLDLGWEAEPGGISAHGSSRRSRLHKSNADAEGRWQAEGDADRRPARSSSKRAVSIIVPGVELEDAWDVDARTASARGSERARETSRANSRRASTTASNNDWKGGDARSVRGSPNRAVSVIVPKVDLDHGWEVDARSPSPSRTRFRSHKPSTVATNNAWDVDDGRSVRGPSKRAVSVIVPGIGMDDEWNLETLTPVSAPRSSRGADSRRSSVAAPRHVWYGYDNRSVRSSSRRVESVSPVVEWGDGWDPEENRRSVRGSSRRVKSRSGSRVSFIDDIAQHSGTHSVRSSSRKEISRDRSTASSNDDWNARTDRRSTHSSSKQAKARTRSRFSRGESLTQHADSDSVSGSPQRARPHVGSRASSWERDVDAFESHISHRTPRSHTESPIASILGMYQDADDDPAPSVRSHRSGTSKISTTASSGDVDNGQAHSPQRSPTSRVSAVAWDYPLTSKPSPSRSPTIDPYSWRRQQEELSDHSTQGSNSPVSHAPSTTRSHVSFQLDDEVQEDDARSIKSCSTYHAPTVEDAPESGDDAVAQDWGSAWSAKDSQNDEDAGEVGGPAWGEGGAEKWDGISSAAEGFDGDEVVEDKSGYGEGNDTWLNSKVGGIRYREAEWRRAGSEGMWRDV